MIDLEGSCSAMRGQRGVVRRLVPNPARRVAKVDLVIESFDTHSCNAS